MLGLLFNISPLGKGEKKKKENVLVSSGGV